MTILAIVGLKSALLLAAALSALRVPQFTAAQRHLVLALALGSLPVMLATALLGTSLFSVEAPRAMGEWMVSLTLPELALSDVSSTRQAGWGEHLPLGPGGAYGIVVAMLLVHWLVQVLRTGRWIERHTRSSRELSIAGSTRRIRIRQAHPAAAPMTWGAFRPVIVLPPDWDQWPAGRRNAVLAHEMAHIARRDTLVSSLSVLVCCLFWINPLVWACHRRLLMEAERACDDAVVSAGTPATDYATELLAVARSRAVPPAHAAASSSTLSQRIRALTDPTTRRQTMNRKQRLGAVLLTAAFMVPLVATGARSDSGIGGAADIREVAEIGETHLTALTKIKTLVDAEAVDEALRLAESLPMESLNTNERAQTHNMLGYIWYRKDDFERSLDHYLEVLALAHGIPEGLERQTYYTAAQLSFVLERYVEAIHHIRSWQRLQAREADPVPHVFIAQVYYKMGDFVAAIPSLRLGIDLAESAGVPVRENWLALLAHLYHEEGRIEDCIDVLQRLRREHPDEKWDRKLEALLATRAV